MALLQEQKPKAWEAFCTLAKEALGEGALSEKIKELMAFSLSIATHCDPCIKVHLRRARQLGATDVEVAETLAVTVLMCGGPADVWPRRIIEEEMGKPVTSATEPTGGCCGGSAESDDDKGGCCCG